MNKFKFGDKVWHDIEPVGFGVVISTENGESYVAFKSGTMDWFSDAELTHVSEWIKCSERMPEEDVDIWVWHKSYHKPLLAYYADELFIEIGSGDWLEVSHYHPLIAPAPPQD